jgi:hypothetical protein
MLKRGVVPILAALFAFGISPVGGQTIAGRLMEVESDLPIELGLIIMLTEGGDSVTATITDEDGDFVIGSRDPGSFVLVASAFGYRETRAGVFELGEGGELDIEFRVVPQPMPLEEMIVALDRPALQHSLIRNGFVRRLQRGLGRFITPYEIERSPAAATAELFRGIPGMVVNRPGGGLFSHMGEQVQMRGPTGLCTPDIYLDGARVSYEAFGLMALENLVPLDVVDAVEVYRRPAEVPIEYGGTQTSDGRGGGCGVLVFWTKRR